MAAILRNQTARERRSTMHRIGVFATRPADQQLVRDRRLVQKDMNAMFNDAEGAIDEVLARAGLPAHQDNGTAPRTANAFPRVLECDERHLALKEHTELRHRHS